MLQLCVQLRPGSTFTLIHEAGLNIIRLISYLLGKMRSFSKSHILRSVSYLENMQPLVEMITYVSKTVELLAL